MARIGIFSSGLWALRREVGILTGAVPVRRWFGARELDAVAGWGFKPTARRARAVAARAGLPYVAIEDGFFRSQQPGRAERSVSYVVDGVGIYYDARGPSALEAAVQARQAQPEQAERDAAPVFHAIRKWGISKYNNFEPRAEAAFARRVGDRSAALVVDQTYGDAAVEGAGATRDTFRAMLIAAVEENPGHLVLIKTHPETVQRRRSGYFDREFVRGVAAESEPVRDAVAKGNLGYVTERLAPMVVLQRVQRTYVVSSLLGLEALVAGVPTTVFGQSFYADWGLTDDRAPTTERRGRASLRALVAAAYCDYVRYFHPVTREAVDMTRAMAYLRAPGRAEA